ncbi:MAG: electron transfer flavoprotein-ubiquinone oxidoreductase, partial [Alphaproteobacteria bacterium]
MAREVMEYDVVIVGGGPSGLTTAIKLKQLNSNLNVCVLEKGAEVGAHILSGNVFETKALDELLPNWKDEGAPIKTKVSKE